MKEERKTKEKGGHRRTPGPNIKPVFSHKNSDPVESVYQFLLTLWIDFADVGLYFGIIKTDVSLLFASLL